MAASGGTGNIGVKSRGLIQVGLVDPDGFEPSTFRAGRASN